MATIEKRGAFSWRIGLKLKQPDGTFEWVRNTVKFPEGTSETAMRKRVEMEAARMELDAETGALQQKQEETLATFADIYIAEYLRPNCSPSHIHTITHMLERRILPELGAVPLHKLTPLMLERFINSLRNAPKRGTTLPPEQRKRKPTQDEIDHYEKQQQAAPETLSDRTVLHYYNCLSGLFKQAVRWDKLSANPMDKVTRPHFKRKKMNFLDDDQAVQLLRALANEEDMSFRAAVLLALTCGLRLGEVGGLRFEDVDFAKGTIDISRTRKYTPGEGSFIGDPKTEESNRLISLPVALLVLLSETQKYHTEVAALLGDRWRGDGTIVCRWDGSPLHHDTPSKQWRKFADSNGFPGVRFHDLRHTHATLLLASNVDAVAVASRLGHSDAETTLREYAHALRKRDLAAAEVMQQLFSAQQTPSEDLGRLQSLHPTITFSPARKP